MKVLDQFSLNGKTALVTGGAGTIGPKFVEALAEAGADVVIADVNTARGHQAAKEISKATGSEVIFRKLDVSNKTQVLKLRDEINKKFKKLDILVNAAIGVGQKHFGPVESCSMDDWNHVMKITTGGTFLCTQVFGGDMANRGDGVILNFASIYGVVGADQRIYGKSGINSPAVYAASKGAIVSMTRYFAVYWAHKGLRVNCISPGGVYNGQAEEFVKKYSARTPMGRMLKSDELKGAVLYLTSPASSYVTGQNLLVDGGWTAW